MSEEKDYMDGHHRCGYGKLRRHCENAKDSLDFGNGRFVRKLLEEAEMNLAERLLKRNVSELTEQMVTTIEAQDVPAVPIKEEPVQKIPLGFAVSA